MIDDNEKPPTFWRALCEPEIWILIVTATGAWAGGAWWVFMGLCLIGLSISALPKYWKLWPKAREVGAEWVWFETVGLSLLNNLGAAAAAFMLGIGVRWLFG